MKEEKVKECQGTKRFPTYHQYSINLSKRKRVSPFYFQFLELQTKLEERKPNGSFLVKSKRKNCSIGNEIQFMFLCFYFSPSLDMIEKGQPFGENFHVSQIFYGFKFSSRENRDSFFFV